MSSGNSGADMGTRQKPSEQFRCSCGYNAISQRELDRHISAMAVLDHEEEHHQDD